MASYLFKNVTWHDGWQKVTGDVRTEGGIILETDEHLQGKKGEQVTEFKNYFIYPGFINGHDHLEMNVYPKLGTPLYKNYIEWSQDIYRPNESPVREIENVSIEDRLLWGGIKNLISGVTTIIHHNPWYSFFEKNDFPVKVLKAMSWVHSLGFGKEIQKEFRRTTAVPFIIHAGEGTDEIAFSEIRKLDQLGLLQKNTVLIHAVAITDECIKKVEQQHASIVWCPASNLFMFNRTAPIDKITGKIKVALGTDSTLTGAPTLLDEMHIAAKTNLASSKQIYEMVTRQPATIFNLDKPAIAPTMAADFFISPIKQEDYFENLMQLGPSDISLVLVNGKLNFVDAEIGMSKNELRHNFKIRGRTKMTAVNIPTLKKRIEKKVPKTVLELNPLWKLLEV